MPKQMFVDFKAVKAAITMEQVLTHYDLLRQFQKERRQPERSLSDSRRREPDAVSGEYQQKYLELFQRMQARRQCPRLHFQDGEREHSRSGPQSH